MTRQIDLMFLSLPLMGFREGGWDGAFTGAIAAGMLYLCLKAMASRDYATVFAGWFTGVCGGIGLLIGGWSEAGLQYGLVGVLGAHAFLWLVAQSESYLGEIHSSQG